MKSMKVSFGNVFSSPINKGKAGTTKKNNKRKSSAPLKSILRKRSYQSLGENSSVNMTLNKKSKFSDSSQSFGEVGNMSLSSLVWSGEASSQLLSEALSKAKQPTPVRQPRRLSHTGIISSSRVILPSFSEDSSDSTALRSRRLSVSKNEPPSVRLRRKRRERGEVVGKENNNTSNKRRKHSELSLKKEGEIPAWRKGIVKALESQATAGEEESIEEQHISSGQVGTILKVWQRLEYDLEKSKSIRSISKEDQMCSLIGKLAINLDVSHRKLVLFLKGDVERKLSQKAIQDIESCLNNWMAIDQASEE
jgi:hypothetical protein